MNREHEQAGLSPGGELRRDAILRDLTAQLPTIVARRRRRKRVVAGGCAMALLLVASAAVIQMVSQPASSPAPPIVEAPVEPAESLIDFAIVRTNEAVDPSVYVRIDNDAINSMVISDDELLRELAQMGRPAGLIRMNGEVRLTRNVVDEPETAEPGSF